MKNIIECSIAHELHHQKPVPRIIGETDQIDQPGALNFGQDIDLVVNLVGYLCRSRGRGGDGSGEKRVRSGGSFDGDGTAVDDGFVDVAVAAFAEEVAVGEAIGGGFKVGVLEVLDLDGFVFV